MRRAGIAPPAIAQSKDGKLSRSSASETAPETRQGAHLRPADFSWSIVPHTHWDREWYLPFDHFRILLARTIDEIVEVLESDQRFRYFTLDGQSILLDDYAELRPPDRVARLDALVRAGRIAVGPLYTQPDELLVGGESLIRNLLMGRQVARRHGAEPMPVGYIPDTFGHVAQLPQILRGFGLDAFVFARGLDDRADELGTAFEWEAPDGSRVMAVRQLGGYGNAHEVGAWGADRADYRKEPERWPAEAAEFFNRYLERWANVVERGPWDHLLLCNGDDHLPIWRPLPELLDHVRTTYPGIRISIDSYAGFIDAVRSKPADLPVVRGELVAGREAPILRGINSTRIYLKQANERTERALRVAESLAALAELGGVYRYPLDELHCAWRELLKNQPHDSLSGCSVDAVHRDMAQRYVTAEAIAERVRREALSALAGVEAGWEYAALPSAELSVVNPLPMARRAVVSLRLPAELADAEGLHLVRTDGVELPVQLDDRDAGRLARTVVDLPGFGSRSVRIVEGGVSGSAAVRAVDDRTIANEFMTVRAGPDGTLTITDRRGRSWPGMLVFEDVADRGDEYTFDPIPGDIPWGSDRGAADVRVLSAGPLVAELEISLRPHLPVQLAATRDARGDQTAELPIHTVVRLASGIDRLEFTTTVDNALRDHRLRVVFASPGAAEPVRSEGAFGVIRRPARMPWRGSGWAEAPAFTAHTSGSVAAGALAVFTIGLPEYEASAIPDGMEIAITLLRCVAFLSRGDLTNRPGHAGPEIETPEAQCPGRHTFEYALHLGDLSDTQLLNASADYRHGFEVGPHGVPEARLLNLEGDLPISALKGAEDRDGVMLRVFNPEQTAASIHLDPVLRVDRVRLDEAGPQEGAAVEPYQIATYRLRNR